MPKNNKSKATAPSKVWIWTLSRLPKKYRENKLFLKALKLAEAIAKSKKGQKGFALVNKPGQAFNEDEVNKTRLHPEIEIHKATGNKRFAFAWYEWPSTKYKQDAIYFNKDKLDKQLKNAKKDPSKEVDIILFLAIVILHETAHWKDEVIKGGVDTKGEEGIKVIDLIFGKPHGDFDIDKEGNIVRPYKPIDPAKKTKWADPYTWKP